jgi:hypothetical protein
VVDYQPGVCNIGPAEIARRRRSGHAAAAATVTVLVILVATRAPRPSRLLIGLPAASAAGGYLQARAHFCAGFGSRGLYNFGPLGHPEEVVGAEARALDRAKARRIGAASIGIGALAAGIAVALPA